MDLGSPPPSTQNPRSALQKILEDESAVRFLRKANAKPLMTGDVLEVFGGAGVGKSELLMGMLVFTILPMRFRDIDIGGNELGVVYFDNDLKFNMSRLVHLLTLRWERAINQAMLDSRFSAAAQLLSADPSAKDKFLFAATLFGLEPLLRSRDTIRIVMIDTLSAFYWQDKLDDGNAQKSSTRAPALLTRLLSQHNIVLVAAKGRLGAPRANGQEDDKDYMPQTWQKLVKYHLTLSREGSSSSTSARFARNLANAHGTQAPPPKTGHFRVENDGISLQ